MVIVYEKIKEMVSKGQQFIKKLKKQEEIERITKIRAEFWESLGSEFFEAESNLNQTLAWMN